MYIYIYTYVCLMKITYINCTCAAGIMPCHGPFIPRRTRWSGWKLSTCQKKICLWRWTWRGLTQKVSQGEQDLAGASPLTVWGWASRDRWASWFCFSKQLFEATSNSSAETGGPPGSASASSSLKRPQTVHVDWTTMQLFANATFLKKTVELTKSMPSKRPYDNTKRSQNAAPAEKTSYKEIALNPARLKGLKEQPHCKCISVCEFIKHSILWMNHVCMLEASVGQQHIYKILLVWWMWGALKTCFERSDSVASVKFLRELWNLEKSEQDSFDARLKYTTFRYLFNCQLLRARDVA